MSDPRADDRRIAQAEYDRDYGADPDMADHQQEMWERAEQRRMEARTR